jgi:hypothetical protein
VRTVKGLIIMDVTTSANKIKGGHWCDSPTPPKLIEPISSPEAATMMRSTKISRIGGKALEPSLAMSQK